MTRRLLTLLGFASIAGLLGSAAVVQSQVGPLTHFDERRLSQPTYRVRTERNVRVRMRDGVELSADIYRPDVEGRFPVLLMRTPYGKALSAAVSGGPYEPLFYAKRGYVVVQQDSRGRFDSAGTFEPFRDDASDGFDTDEWIGRQPWSSGKIGGLGQSYFGVTQLYQAIKASRYLTTIIPVMTTLEAYNNWIHLDGAFYLGFAMPWGTGLGIPGRPTREASNRPAAAAPNVPASAAYAHLPLLTMDEAQVKAKVPYFREWAAHSARDAYWALRSPTSQLNQVAAPALFITGWYDFFGRGALKDFTAIRRSGKTEAARTGTRLIVGPWIHYSGPEGASRKAGDMDFGPAADVNQTRVQLRWFDYWLKGMPTGVADDPPVMIFVMGANYWRNEREWPLARAKYIKHYLHSGGRANTGEGNGRLSTDPPTNGAPTDTYTYDPSDPAPTVGGSVFGTGLRLGPVDQRPVERRQDVLVYTSAVLTQPVEVTGPISVKLFAATTAKDTDFTAKLVDVHPDGFVQILQDGIIRARFRTSLERAQLVEPGKVHEYTIDLWATSNVFLPGHRIRVDISSSNFPRFDRNLNTGEDTATGSRMVKATQTIYHDAAHPSHIVLPTIP